MTIRKRTKYGNKKVYRYNRWFDSIAEADYYPIAVAYAEDHGYKLKLQDRLDILPTLKLNQWAIRKTQYVADYAFYNQGELIRLVDVKGMEINDVRIFLGHSSIATTQQYIDTSGTNFKQIHDKYVA